MLRAYCNWSGARKSANIELPMRFTVVSCPAMYNSTTKVTNSSAVSLSPDSSAEMSEDNMSVPRLRRRSLMVSSRKGRSPANAASASSRSANPTVGSSVRVMTCDHSRSSSARLVGMPNIAEITKNGTGKATSSISSKVPPSRTRRSAASRASSTNRCTMGRSESMALGVNDFDTSRRSRVWSGGSRLRIDFDESRRRSRMRLRIGSSMGRADFSMSRL